jgi:hypothetical protein
VRALTRIGSDHNPILVEDGEGYSKIKKWFVFEAAWLANDEFKTQLKEKWHVREGVEPGAEQWRVEVH